MICPKCLKKVEDDARFCNWCGVSFDHNTDEAVPNLEAEETPDISINDLPKGYVTKLVVIAGIKQAVISSLGTFGVFFILALILSFFGVCLTSRGGQCLNNIWDLFAIPIVLGIFAFIGVGWNTLKILYKVYFPPR